MPESTCLYIQEHESGPIRVVDIPWISVRIGRAAFCEVRLMSDDLADVACRLYRRGRSWHLVPGAGSQISLHGRAIDASCPLPFDAPLKIGNYCLTLRTDRAANPDWGIYPESLPAEPKRPAAAFEGVHSGRDRVGRPDLVIEPQQIAVAPFKPDWRTDLVPEGPAPGATYPAGASVKDRWQTRWRAAGAELKARAERSSVTGEPKRATFQAGFDAVPLKEPRELRAAPTARSRPESPIQPIPTTFGPTRVEPSREIPTGDPAEIQDLSQQMFEARIEPTRDEPPIADEPLETISPVDAGRDAVADDESWYEMPAMDPRPEKKPGNTLLETPSRPAHASRKRAAKPSRATESDRPRPALSRGRKSVEAKRETPSRPRIDKEPLPFDAQRPEPARAVKPAQWPSARDILASHQTSVNPRASTVPAPRPTLEAGLTVSRQPAQWTLPVWLAGPAAAAFVVAIGLVGGMLSWWWSTDAYAVSLMTGRLMGGEGRAQRGGLPESIVPPDGTWTRSTAQHLAHWAIFKSRDEQGQAASPLEVASLLNRALQISPLNPTARLALAQLEPPELGAPISQRALGLSRDAISLSWCARRLMAAGDKEGALKIFEKALSVATRDLPSRAAMPQFSDDPSVPRYLLPGEERVRDIVLEMLAKDEWTFREWSAALPKDPRTILAAARMLKKKGSSETDTLLDLVLDDHHLNEGSRATSALARAARAEALALKSRWRESEEQYRLAIEAADDDTIKRSWWFNLADVELRLDDEIQRQSALRAALADASDEISRRATENQGANSTRPLSVSSGPKAN
jgi:tetratricopeptide (TPR) repeat protein